MGVFITALYYIVLKLLVYPTLLVDVGFPGGAGRLTDEGLIPGLGRSPGGGQSDPLQYSCLVNPVDRGAWWATVRYNREAISEA